MADKLLNAIQVVNVKTGMSYIRHNQCVGEDEVITSTSVQFPAERTSPYTCGHCAQAMPLCHSQNRPGESGAFGGIFDRE